METRHRVTVDGNEAATSVAYRASEVIAIYPITPSSPMAELADEWSVKGRRNLWGTVPQVAEMQSEAGAAGAVHGALQAGALSTTFTASQGLLLMLPAMYKIAGELTGFTMHVAARAIATSALSIFGDHSDVMACRQTGFALLASGSVQEVHDLACVAHAAGLRSRIPFLHFFDGFRTSHEVSTMEELSDDDLRHMLDEQAVLAHRARALTPDRPVIRGTAANPDTYFQSREAVNPFYLACPGIVQDTMDRFAALTGRRYRLFDYAGHPEAERVIVVMGSAADVTEETVEYQAARGERVGVVKVRLYRPFSVEHVLQTLPVTTRAIAVLDRTKEPGSPGEPLYLDVVAALQDARQTGRRSEITVIGGRYGIGSKELDPAMVIGVLDELAQASPKNHFTMGIRDDVAGTSVDYDPQWDIEPDDVVRAVFVGLGADGTVGANKNSIKIIGEETGNYAQGYFVYDSKKSGGVTISHLRFGPRPIRSSYLIKKASFVACHQYRLLDKIDVLAYAGQGATFLLNTPYGPDEVWDELPREVQRQIHDKEIDLWVIDAFAVAGELGLGFRINTIMQTCFFAISGVLPREEAIAQIKGSIEKTYGRKGTDIVRRNFEAVDGTLAGLFQVEVPAEVTATRGRPPAVAERAPAFVKEVTAAMMVGHGDELPVSALPVDGTWPTGTTKWEKRNIALEIPIWDPAVCIQCGKCAFACPHATIRTKLYDPAALEAAPAGFRSVEGRGRQFEERRYTVQVAPEDCTGCRLCVMVCPGKDRANPSHKAINMASHREHVETEKVSYEFFLSLPESSREELPAAETKLDVKTSQLLQPLFEFSGACAGCGETQYIKLLTQLFGDRALIANATGCSSIYGGNLPTTPYTTNAAGRGPAWSNSLFEDNAEFGLGMRLAVDKQTDMARELLSLLAPEVSPDTVEQLLNADQSNAAAIATQRERVAALRTKLGSIDRPEARRLESLADHLVKKSVWIVGGDGWAYDIGYGGLDHVLFMDRDVNILVLDTEVYSNTGGQMSKSTPMGAIAKFAAGGKAADKKDLGLMAMTYGNVYVAQVAWGARDTHTVRAFEEAEAYPGTSLIIGYAHCIGHGYDLAYGAAQQKLAVESGRWLLYRYDPRLEERGENPLQLDSAAPKASMREFVERETRFRMLERLDPDRAKVLFRKAEQRSRRHYRLYEQLSRLTVGEDEGR
ncbi:MAG: pyruvate:ferredoxin (flavodoxin) oxidoreductase [Thermoleophilia bacterium]|nr:pyruvate:ferredoxin (flavodoxin) oxidoreductase [Thermoleophilia bacterium]